VPERSHWRVRPRATKTPDDDRSLSPLRARAWARIIRVHAAAEFVAHAVDRGESYTREGRTSTIGGFNGRCRMVVACARTRLMSLRRIASTSIHYVVIIVSVSLIILIRRVAFDVCITVISRYCRRIVFYLYKDTNLSVSFADTDISVHCEDVREELLY